MKHETAISKQKSLLLFHSFVSSNINNLIFTTGRIIRHYKSENMRVSLSSLSAFTPLCLAQCIATQKTESTEPTHSRRKTLCFAPTDFVHLCRQLQLR
jgi:hypothetical protein